eukprot:gnl/MRDRNA2_/MRDRNA2_87597_c0_seq1.p1 gnl/MRDRNA2_/MRDRNA2_87597_c0~~gnl/MRDRNA2_/MRDRNA2_87597_c0_seq1.p1  ORF type:complete len:355 (-),score=106.68 gnl/MRDRNA2_/MRDRNA2_87597_c0_seq1:109-1122(-)
MSEDAVLPKGLVGQLPSKWNALCNRKKTSLFAWAHNGKDAGNAWVHLLPDGQLKTKWNGGKWEAEKKDDRLHLIFGSVRHVCVLQKNDTFEVTERIKEKTGKQMEHPKVKDVETHSAGWPISEKKQEAAKVDVPKRKAASASEEPTGAKETPRKRARTAIKEPLEGLNVFLILAQAQASRDRKAVRPTAVMGRIQKNWEGMTEESKQEYADEFKKLKVQYSQAMKQLRSSKSAEVAPKDGENAEAADAALPKKPVGGAFSVFAGEKRSEILKAETSAEERKMSKVTKRIKELWDALDENQKQPYLEQYASRKKAYDDAVEEQKKVAQQQRQATQGGS